MNGASKILTVSYGTFSCTLEGFDDPFNTMKAIAEYFRDLAAEDRYFGAEPPTPDAAMLHRIAEREIQRRVEAKIQENGVVLRASETAEPSPVAATVEPAPVSPPVAVVAPAPAPAPAAEPAVAPVDAAATESVVAKLSRLRSEVAAQPGIVSPVTTMPTVSFAIPDYLEDEHAEVIEAAPLPDDLTADALPEDVAPAIETAADMPQPEETAPAGDAAEDEAILAALTDLTEPVAEPAAIAEPVVEAFAADGDDLSPTVAEAELGTDAEPDLPESLMAALADSTSGTQDDDVIDVVAIAGDDLPDAAPALTDDIALEGLSDLIAEAEVIETEVIEVAAAEVDDPTDLPAHAEVEEEDEPAATLEVAEAPLAALDDARDAQEAAVDAAFADEEEIDLSPAVDEVAPGPELRPGAAEKLQRARARVIRIRRGDDAEVEAAAQSPVAEIVEAEVEAADAQPATITPVRPRRVSASAPQTEPEVEAADEEPTIDAALYPVAQDEDAFESNLSSIFAEVEEEEVASAPAKPAAATPAAMEEAEEAVDGLLSAEDEAELMRELAALRTNEEDAPDGMSAGASAFVFQQEARKGFSGPTADEALGRLMKQTDSEMEGAENKRRQSAIAHLKAAVAATVADRKVTGEKPADTAGVSRLARYRNDLAMVVKSALPGRGGSDAPKERPAPLVLVSEQRIDKPRPAPLSAPAPAAASAAQGVQTVRPRRVSATGSGLAMQAAEAFDEDDADEEAGNVLGDTRGFSDFVDQVGAVTLEEILEASAAYLAGVEGLESFSRPQVMHHLGAVVPPGTFQREDGLRGFGTLLRNGRIAKLRRGQFVLSEESPYLAEARKIAG